MTIIVTGGAGFIGSNLIKKLILETNSKIISLDNYSSGFKKNHISSKRVIYIKGDTKNFDKIFKKKAKKIKAVFHFGEFSRIFQSFIQKEKCFEANIRGSYEVINFCLKNNIRIIYSATSAVLGNINNINLSPYAFTKGNNLNFIINLNKWFGLKYSIIYFYNVYGANHIKNSPMSAVVGIFEEQYKKNIPLSVVRPGNQKRSFTNIEDTIDCCIFVYKKKLNRQYAVFNKKTISIFKLANLFSNKIKYLKKRDGERFVSKFPKKYRGIKIYTYRTTNKLEDYIKNFKMNLNHRQKKIQ